MRGTWHRAVDPRFLVGALSTLHTATTPSRFSPARGAAPAATNGNFYGVTYLGGAIGACYPSSDCGTVFSLSVGLGLFVKTQPGSGEVGAAVEILGTDLMGATGVSFNGTAAAFTVVSPSLITTSVPTGATSGKIQVVTPTGTL